MQDASLTLIGVDEPEAWDRATADGLPSHSWHYAAGLAKAGMAPQLAIIRAKDVRLILPFHLRRWGPHTDVATLPGLSGALILPLAADALPLLDLWGAHARAQGWVTGYLQLSPRNPKLIAPPADAIAAHNVLFEFDLARWQFDRDVRKKVRWALRNGDRDGARLITSGPAMEEAVLRLYPEAMQRLDGEIFPPSTLRTWFADPGLRLFGAELDGRIEAVELCRLRGVQAELHLAGSTLRGRSLHGWLIWQMAEWFRDQGAAVFNIGGYGVEGDGLHDMKRRLGTIEQPMRSLRQIYRPDLYVRLCERAGTNPDQLYFPAYRRGVPPSDPDAPPDLIG
jgi:hypothetical protein